MSDHAHSQPHGASSPGAHEHGHDDHDHGGLGKYVYVFIALCVLTAASFWTYADWPVKWPYHKQPAVGWAFMLAVASTKAMLVILFFMHVKYEASWKYVLTIPPGIMALLLMCALVARCGAAARNGGWRTQADRRGLVADGHPCFRGRAHRPGKQGTRRRSRASLKLGALTATKPRTLKATAFRRRLDAVR